MIQSEKRYSPEDLESRARAIVALIPALRGQQVRMRPLKGGLTNRNYLLTCGGQRFVLRVMGDNSRLLGINRRAEYACLQAAHAAGIGAEVVAFFPQEGALVTRFVTGRVLKPEVVRRPTVLRRVVGSLRHYHEHSKGAGTFCAFGTVRRYHAEGRQRKVHFPANFRHALRVLDRIESERGFPDHICHCHNDLLSGNLVDDRRKIWILDWEYGGRGDLFFDLGNLAANNLFGHEHERKLLEFYFGEVRVDDLKRLRLMRLVSDLREAMWGYLQTRISKLDFDYETYARGHFERFLEGAERLF